VTPGQRQTSPFRMSVGRLRTSRASPGGSSAAGVPSPCSVPIDGGSPYVQLARGRLDGELLTRVTADPDHRHRHQVLRASGACRASAAHRPTAARAGADVRGRGAHLPRPLRPPRRAAFVVNSPPLTTVGPSRPRRRGGPDARRALPGCGRTPPKTFVRIWPRCWITGFPQPNIRPEAGGRGREMNAIQSK
jgi:hypothetical protein